MSLTSRIANLITSTQSPQLAPTDGCPSMGFEDGPYRTSNSANAASRRPFSESWAMEEKEAERRPRYLHSMISGGIGGTTGDLLMHSLDTVKTRQQGDTRTPQRYTSMSSTYSTILRQEGFRKGLYSGITPAFLGSFPGTVIFFGIYEFSKWHLIDRGVPHSLAYLAGGFLADLAASFVYVPSEVLKTRLQLQGRYNNKFTHSGYNYRSALDAFRTIIRTEGWKALYYGYKATIFRDLPFSAIQFAIYEQERNWAKKWVGNRDIGISLEIATAATAGGMAGILTCPLDVVKTRIQTQLNPNHAIPIPTRATSLQKQPATVRNLSRQRRNISTSLPNTSVPKPGAVNLDTSSVITGLRLIFKTEGLVGWFRGVGPRAVWTSVQSGTMLVMYQYLLRKLEDSPWAGRNEGASIV